jgi:hypothetical protein
MSSLVALVVAIIEYIRAFLPRHKLALEAVALRQLYSGWANIILRRICNHQFDRHHLSLWSARQWVLAVFGALISCLRWRRDYGSKRWPCGNNFSYCSAQLPKRSKLTRADRIFRICLHHVWEDGNPP